MKSIEDFLQEEINESLSKKIISSQPAAPLPVSEVLKNSLPIEELFPQIVEVGEVVYIGDGVCKITGLSNARIDDILRIVTEKGDVLVLVLGLTDNLVETVVLGEYFGVKKGQLVYSTQSTLKMPAGEEVLGRVISPIGKPLDGLGEVKKSAEMETERPAPPVSARTPITEQVVTGFAVIDSIIPVGHGQRELVTGDRKTGKTRLVADIICNMKGKNIFCIYVTIGGQKAKVKAFSEYLKKRDAMKYTVIVMGCSDDPPSLNYLAPYSGTAIAEYFCDHAQNALIIYDDLSKHAKAYRQMSLLLKRSPGRDAYPGDIFYLHSRLLERSARVTPAFGGGSITAMPVSETQNGDISEYITTNLMSITDGHIYLDAQLMHDGVLPAVNSGASVSRIGGGVQPPVLRKYGAIAGSQLARYNDVKSYETMNTEITEETEREINCGKRILEVFNQPSTYTYTVSEEVILLYAVTSGVMNYIALDLVAKLKAEIVDYYRQKLSRFNDLTHFTSARDKSINDKETTLLDEFIESFIADNSTDAAKALKEAWNKRKEKEAPPEKKETLDKVTAGSGGKEGGEEGKKKDDKEGKEDEDRKEKKAEQPNKELGPKDLK